VALNASQNLAPTTAPKSYRRTKEEVERGIQYFRSGDCFRLKHMTTGKYLATQPLASSMTTTNTEISTMKKDESTFVVSTIWKVELNSNEIGQKIMTKRDIFRIVSHAYGVKVFASLETLPAWGFSQREINGIFNVQDEIGNVWAVQAVEHERIVNGMPLYTP
jgi:dolichyl-phosphate-mannose--protein O-mannosyl transferase